MRLITSAFPFTTTLHASPTTGSQPSTSKATGSARRGKQLGACAGPEDDRAVVDQMVDRQTVRPIVHDDAQTYDDDVASRRKAFGVNRPRRDGVGMGFTEGR